MARTAASCPAARSRRNGGSRRVAVWGCGVFDACMPNLRARFTPLWLAILCAGCTVPAAPESPRAPSLELFVLGIAQDGGVPHFGCEKPCCASARASGKELFPACLGIVARPSSELLLVEATPRVEAQVAMLHQLAETSARGRRPVDAVLLTHAHIGHYTGLMQFGREVMGTRSMPVWAMPRMRDFLTTNGPWSQLVRLEQIALQPLTADSIVTLGDSLQVTPFRVPHRDEYSETVGFRIMTSRGAVVFLPDVDKWERWDRRIEDAIAGTTAAYLDGTFFDASELPGRDMREIPHPFIVESLARFASGSATDRARVRFIHLNHTNRAAIPESEEQRRITRAGSRVAVIGERVTL